MLGLTRKSEYPSVAIVNKKLRNIIPADIKHKNKTNYLYAEKVTRQNVYTQQKKKYLLLN